MQVSSLGRLLGAFPVVGVLFAAMGMMLVQVVLPRSDALPPCYPAALLPCRPPLLRG